MDERTITIHLQNETTAPVAPEEFSLIRGAWVSEQSPDPKTAIESGDSITWKCRCNDVGVGIAGFVNLNSHKGQVELTFNLPWAEPFHCEVRSPKGIKKHVTPQSNEDDPHHPVVTVTVTG